MCRLAFHNCPACGEEYKCDQPNSECPVINNYDGPCEKCEWWLEEERKEQERYERMMWEREQYEREQSEYERYRNER
jgi:hypothetical protein